MIRWDFFSICASETQIWINIQVLNSAKSSHLFRSGFCIRKHTRIVKEWILIHSRRQTSFSLQSFTFYFHSLMRTINWNQHIQWLLLFYEFWLFMFEVIILLSCLSESLAFWEEETMAMCKARNAVLLSIYLCHLVKVPAVARYEIVCDFKTFCCLMKE